MSKKDPAEKAIRDIRRKTRRKHSTEEKIRIVSVIKTFGTVEPVF